jgi:hypothetical protein
LKLRTACFAALAAVLPALAAAADFSALPQKKLFAPFPAYPTYPAFNLRYAVPAGSGSRAEINMGDEFGLVSAGFADGGKAQLGIMGGVAARFDISKVTNDFEITDFSLAFPVDYIRGDWAFRAMYWHTSSHIGDDFIKSNAIASQLLSKNVTDEFRFYAAYDPVRFLRLYAGPAYAFNLIPSVNERWRFHAGAQARTGGAPVSYFAAADFQSLERNSWNPSFTARAGVRREAERSAVSAYAEFFAGRQPYLGFMTQSETKWSLGFAFEM